MTTSHPDLFDVIAEADAHHDGARSLVANDPRHDEDYARFVDALFAAAHVEGKRWLISQNDLRLQLVEQTMAGPRCSIQHNRYSAYFSRARKEDLVRVAKNWDGTDVFDICTTSFTGNNGKPQKVYELLTRT